MINLSATKDFECCAQPTQEKYLQALSLCCSNVLEVDLTAQKFVRHLFINDKQEITTGDYDYQYVFLLCEKIASKFKQNAINMLEIKNLKAACVQDKPFNFKYFLQNENTHSTGWRECHVGFNKQPQGDLAIITVKDITVENDTAKLICQNMSLIEQQILDERYKIVVEETGTIVFEYFAANGVPYISPLMAKMFKGNYHNGCDVIAAWREGKVIHPEDDKLLSNILEHSKNPLLKEPIHIRLLDKKNHYIWCKLQFIYSYDKNGSLERILAMLNNEDEIVSSRLLLEYRAQYDILTGVYNAQTFYMLSHNILREHPENNYIIMRMDIIRFKAINELYGIEEGDRILCRIATAIENEIFGAGICGRLYSDIFAICTPAKTQADAINVIYRIAKAVEKIMPGSGIRPYFGIYMVNDRTTPTNILCDRAGLALAQVKGSMLKNYAFYDEFLHQKELAERNIETQMELALQNGEFVIFLQPKHSLLNSLPIGAEALVRWRHPKEGLLSPCSFLPLFERNGFIVKLDEFVWEEVFKLVRKWLDKNLSPVPVSINVSRVHIYNPNFVQKIIYLLQKYNVPGYLVELELTESTFVDNQEELYKTLTELQDRGINFSIDDFGSGYSSLNMLKNSPAGILKLDREFLCAADGNQKAQTVVQHTISMANQLNMQVVAEGVENESQAKFLINAGCLAAQGFFYSHPMPVEEFEKKMIYC